MNAQEPSTYDGPADTRTRDDSCIDMEEADDCGAPIQSDDANPPSTGEIALKRKK